MRTAIILLALLAVTSCACVSKPHSPYDPVHPGRGATVSFYMRNPSTAFPRFDVYLRFTQKSSYTHLVQEIELPGGYWLVECFRMPRGSWIIDHHSGTGWRRMKVYPANVVGALEPWGFAHLMQNQDGTVRTNIPLGFNTEYRKACGDGPWPGVITKQAPEDCCTWRLTNDNDLGVTEVWLPDGILFVP